MKRDRYAECGVALRLAHARALAAGLSAGELRVLAAVVDATVSWSKLSDRVAVATLADQARVSRRHAQRVLKKLAALAIVVYEPGEGGRSNVARIGLPSGSGKGDIQRSPFAAPKGDTPDAERATSRGRPSEKNSEKTTPLPPSANGGGRPLSRRDLRRFTGCRATRGTHGAGWKRDPLGTDKPPPDWPHDRPTEDEVLAALEAEGVER